MPNQSVPELLACFEKALNDGRFSPAEFEVLSSLVSEARLTTSEMKKLRLGLFGLVEDQMRCPESRQFVRWLEGATASLLPADLGCPETRVYFTPGRSCEEVLCRRLGEVKEFLDICVFTITNDRLSKAVKACHDRGVRVRIITDNEKARDQGSDVAKLASCGIAVRQDASEDHMHHKFAILDKVLVISGSYNWTRSAQFNHENLIMTTDAFTTAAFAKEFQCLWQGMKRLIEPGR